MGFPLLLLEGVFVLRDPPEGLVVTDVVRGDTQVDEFLDPYDGNLVELSLHHHPAVLDKSQPGGGSCLWGGFCPHGHRENPSWLLHQRLSGVLKRRPSGWDVGGTPLKFSQMPGHHGRLVLLDSVALEERVEDAASSARSIDDLVQEAAEMTQVLKSLRGILEPDNE